MLGIPTEELKQAATHADRTLTDVDIILSDTKRLLLYTTAMMENLNKILLAIRGVK